jgi:thioredoxin-disulfide reductase
MKDCIVIGGGPAGLTASLYLSRYNLNNIIIAKDFGMAAETNNIENYPGFVSITGHELLQKFTKHAKHFNTEIVYDEVISVSKINAQKFIIKTKTNQYSAKTVILAMGTKKKKLNLPGEDKFKGKGVSYCATCDAALFKDSIVGVVGGRNSAMSTAILLSKYNNKVHMFVRSQLKGEPIMKTRITNDKNISVHLGTEVEEIFGSQMVEGVKLKPTNDTIKTNDTNDTTKTNDTIELKGLFIEAGLVPSTELVKDLVKLDNNELIQVTGSMQTSEPGVFAAGDITTGSDLMLQIVVASAEGAIAARSVYDYISKLAAN